VGSLFWGPSTWALPRDAPPPPPIQSHSPLCVSQSQHLSLTAIGQKKASSHTLVIRDTRGIGTERGAQVGPTCSISEQQEPLTKPQVNPRSSCAYLRIVFINKIRSDYQISRSLIHCKKELAVFPSPAGMSLIKLFLGGNNLVFSRPERVWSVTSRLGTGKWLTLFYSVLFGFLTYYVLFGHFSSQKIFICFSSWCSGKGFWFCEELILTRRQ
jgi:hypothetical protein